MKIVLFSTLLFLFSLVSLSLVEFINIPSQINVFEGEGQSIDINYPYKIISSYEEDDPVVDIINLNGSKNKVSEIKIVPLKQGQTDLEVKLLGFLPLKKLKV